MKEMSIESKESFFSDRKVDLQCVCSPYFSFIIGSKSQKVETACMKGVNHSTLCQQRSE